MAGYKGAPRFIENQGGNVS